MEVLESFLDKVIINIFEPVVYLLGILALLYFVFGVLVYIKNAENEEARTTGQRHMFWAIIGLAIIFGANAIISFIGGTVESVLP